MEQKLTLFQNAKNHENRIAFVGEFGELTYGALLKKSETFAMRLLNGKSDLDEARIAFLAPAGPEYAIIQWGIWRAGGIAVPLSIGASAPELEYCLGCASVSQVVLGLPSKEITTLCDKQQISILIFDDIKTHTEVTLPTLDMDRRAMILFTSGTTNKPKGVVTTHANIEAQVRTLVDFWEWRKEDIIPLFLPMHHIHGIINVMTCALFCGAKIDCFSFGFDMTAILNQVKGRVYSLFMAVPTIYVKIIHAMEKLPTEERDEICSGFRYMRLMISGSAALPIKIHEQWQALTGQILLERYGMTEIGMALSNPLSGERRPGAVGIPLPGVDIQLVGEGGNIIENENDPGEILVKGAGIFLEYWQNAKATKESFKDGWFLTGDMAVLEQGYYRIMGRLSVDIIKSGGYKLSALEIENYLLGHNAVKECAVLGIEDEIWGEVVATIIVLNEGSVLTLEDLQHWSKDKMSNYKIPRKLRILEGIPKNAMGKVKKPDLKVFFN